VVEITTTLYNNGNISWKSCFHKPLFINRKHGYSLEERVCKKCGKKEIQHSINFM